MNGLGSPTQDHVEENQDNVQGWLMNVPGYRQQPHATTLNNNSSILVDADNNRFEIVYSIQVSMYVYLTWILVVYQLNGNP